MKLTRREMLGTMLAGAAAAALPTLSFAAATPHVVAYRGEQAATLRKVIDELGGIKQFVAKGDRVVIKPNLGFATPADRGANTDPVVLRTLAEMILAAGAKSIQILDNPVHPIVACEARNGIKHALAGLDDVHIQLVKDEDFFVPVQIPRGRQLKSAAVMRPVIECDALFNVPVAKSHGGSIVSFSMKNWMGVVKDRRTWHADLDLHQAIADFSTYIKPKLIILDATRVLATGGPGGPGEVKVVQTIIGGTDPVAIDSLGVGLSTWNGKAYKPADVPFIRIAAEMGLGQILTAPLAAGETAG